MQITAVTERGKRSLPSLPCSEAKIRYFLSSLISSSTSSPWLVTMSRPSHIGMWYVPHVCKELAHQTGPLHLDSSWSSCRIHRRTICPIGDLSKNKWRWWKMSGGKFLRIMCTCFICKPCKPAPSIMSWPTISHFCFSFSSLTCSSGSCHINSFLGTFHRYP